MPDDIGIASELILTNKKHLDNNTQPISKENIMYLLKMINNNNIFSDK